MRAISVIRIVISCWLLASHLPTGFCVGGEFDFSFGTSGSNDAVIVFEGDTAILRCSTDPSMAVDVEFLNTRSSSTSSSGSLAMVDGGSRALVTNGSLMDDRQSRLSIGTTTKLVSRHELVMRNVRVNDSGVYRLNF